MKLLGKSEDDILRDLETSNISYDKLLCKSARIGVLIGVKILLDAGANVHANSDEALRNATWHGHTEVVKLLLEAGADVHAWNDQALENASRKGNIELVKILLDAGANVHAENNKALNWASYNHHSEIIKLLKNKI